MGGPRDHNFPLTRPPPSPRRDPVPSEPSTISDRETLKHRIRRIAETCNRTNHATAKNIQNLLIDLEDERFKDRNFHTVFTLLRELEGVDASIIESLYQYKMNDNLEFEEETRVVTREYKMGALDPTKDISKFE